MKNLKSKIAIIVFRYYAYLLMKNNIKNFISASGFFILSGVRKKININEIKSVLIISMYFKGDALFTTKLLPVLKTLIPDVKTDYLVKPRAKNMLENNEYVSDVIEFDNLRTSDYEGNSGFSIKEKKSLIKLIRNKKYDLCIDLTGKYSTALISLLGGFKYSAGINYNGFGFCYSKFINTDTQNTKGHLSDKYLNVLKEAFDIETGEWDEIIDRVNPKCNMNISADEKLHAEKIISGLGIDPALPLISIQTTAGWKAKQWTPEGYAGLIKKLLNENNVLLLGSEGDREFNYSILDSIDKRLRKYFIPQSMRINSAIISISDLFIGCDSVGLQIAGITGTPAIGLFGPTNPDFSAPDSENVRIIYNELSCSAPADSQYCTRNAGKTCMTLDCMKSIECETILKYVNDLIVNHSNSVNEKD